MFMDTVSNLLKFPAASNTAIENEIPDETEMQHMLRIMFAQRNKNRYAEIVKAIASGDIRLAHRIVHTLKGNAGQIGKTNLHKIAGDVAELLRAGMDVPQNMMYLLETELTLVLEELNPILDESRKGAAPLDAGQTVALLERLEPMLVNLNPECLDLLDALRDVFGAEELVSQIEEFDLNSALDTLAGLKEEWRGLCG